MEWIDVNDRLPAEGEIVLAADFIVFSDKDYWIAEITYFTMFDPVWWEIQECKTIRPTHWMEIPKSPFE